MRDGSAVAEGVTVYLSLGSNLGDREANLRRALALLGRALTITACSSIYETEPWGYREQGKFLNLVCAARTSRSSRALLELTKEVERRLGRKATFRYGPRAIDVDILLYGSDVVNEPDLCIPHAAMSQRAFVLAPLAELAPDLVHPTLMRTVAQLLAEAPGREDVRLCAPALEGLGTVLPRKVPRIPQG